MRNNSFSEGDRKAYYESSQWAMKQNNEKITGLRKENKELHKLVSDRLAVSAYLYFNKLVQQ